jgi:6-phosphogluconolactonase
VNTSWFSDQRQENQTMITSKLSDVTAWFFETISSLQSTQETVTIGLPGGSSLDGWYAELVSELSTKYWVPSTSWIDLKKVRFCMVDERCVSIESPDRNDAHVWKTFLEPLCEKGILKPEQFIRPGEIVDALEYTEHVWTIDIGIFGLGPDGHIASLFPQHPALDVQTEGYIRIHEAPKQPPERISLTALSVEDIPHTCLFAVGEQKKEALANFLDENTDYTDCPAKILVPEIVFDGIN